MKVVDLTHTVAPDMPVYPGTQPPSFEPANTYERDGFKETSFSMFTHTGTHIDPPAHLYPGRTTESYVLIADAPFLRAARKGGGIPIGHSGCKWHLAVFLYFPGHFPELQ